jgi:glycosyltransferase involved in cell wall biosynthesis
MTTVINPETFDAAAVAAFSQEAFNDVLERLAREARELAARLKLDWEALIERAPEQHSPAKQALTIAKLGLFDEDWYLASYSDVRAAGFDPIIHYVNLGDAEGRRPNAFFDPAFYRSQFVEQPLQSVGALYHYAVLGESIGLRASGAFSPRRYLVSNAKLQGWLDKPLTHFLHLGRAGGLMANHRARLSSGEKIRFEKVPSPRSPGKVNPAEGLNLIGPLDRVSGLGISARGYLEGLRRAGVTQVGCRAQQREFAIQKSIAGSVAFPPYLPDAKVNLVHMNGDTLPVMFKEQGDEFLRGKYNIAVWFWELPTLRPEWQVSMKYFHEFWASTPFIARLLRQSTAKPVRLVPPYLSSLENLQPGAQPPPHQSHFVYCFDANSIVERKNPGVLLDAFRKAFPSSTDARLTFKVTYPNRKIPEVDRLYRAATEDARIQIIDRLMSDAELHALIGSASAYVSPHRSEGLGMTVIEAMASRVPVISTQFGGVDAFVGADTAFPIDVRYCELEDDYLPYPQGFVWADPDLDSLAAQMMLVHNNREEALERADIARHRVLEYYCSPTLVGIYKKELSRIAGL